MGAHPLESSTTISTRTLVDPATRSFPSSTPSTVETKTTTSQSPKTSASVASTPVTTPTPSPVTVTIGGTTITSLETPTPAAIANSSRPSASPNASRTSSIPTSATPTPTSTGRAHRGLTITTTVGIGIGVAAVAIIIFVIAFVCIRRRRRKWGKKRKAQGDFQLPGDTPDEEIAKKAQRRGSVEAFEMGGGEAPRAELGGGGVLGEKKEKGDVMVGNVVGELDGGQVGAGERGPVEMGSGEGSFFVAELDSREIERMKSVKMLKKEGKEEKVPPMP